MTIPIFIGIAAVIFIVGVIFVVKGISSEEQEAVPISNLEEIRDLKKAFVPPEVSEPVVPAPAQTKAPSEVQAQDAVVIEQNHQLRQDLSEQKEKFKQLEKDLEALTKAYTQMQDQKANDSAALNKEKAKFDSEKELLSSKSDLLTELKIKTEMLEKRYEEAEKQRDEMVAMTHQLKAERDQLLAQTKAREEQMALQLKEQKTGAAKMEFETLSAKLIESIALIENLKRENKDLQKANSDLNDTFKKTQELNAHLLTKEKMMQYELTKNRAQALGLEKMCEDFKTRIETMAEAAGQ